MAKQNKILAFPHDQRLYEQAAAWVVLLADGPLDADALRRLRAWVDQSARHKKILLDTARVWDRLDVIAGLAGLLELQDAPMPGNSARDFSRNFARNSRFLPAAVGLAVLFCLGAAVYFHGGQFFAGRPGPILAPQEAAAQVYQTQRGEHKTVHLEDGSVMQLNTASRIEIIISATGRRARLLAGEAYFDVVRDQNRPFIVTAGRAAIRAIGTAFSVQRLPGYIEVTVAEGLVQVARPPQAAVSPMSSSMPLPATSPAAAPAQPFTPVLLRAGQLMRISRSGKAEARPPVRPQSRPQVHTRIHTLTPEHLARKLLWQQGMLAFDGDTLQEVVAQFSRYTAVDISITDVETAAIKVGGYFRSDDIAGLLSSLEANFAIEVRQTAANRFTLQKAP